MSIDVGELILRLRADITQLVRGMRAGEGEVKAAGQRLQAEGTQVNAALRRSLEQMSPAQRQQIKDLLEARKAQRETRLSTDALAAAEKAWTDKMGATEGRFGQLHLSLKQLQGDYAAGLIGQKQFAASTAALRAEAVALRAQGVAPVAKELTAFNAVMNATAQRSGLSGRNLYYLERTMGTVAASSVGLNSRIGYLAKDLLLLGGSAGVMTAVLGVTALVGVAFDKWTQKTREQRQATDELIDSLNKERDAQSGADVLKNRALLTARLTQLQKDLAAAEAARAAAQTAGGAAGGGQSVQYGGTGASEARIAAIRAQIDNVTKDVQQLDRGKAFKAFDDQLTGVWHTAQQLDLKLKEVGAPARDAFIAEQRAAGLSGEAIDALLVKWDRLHAAETRQKQIDKSYAEGARQAEAALRGIQQTMQDQQRTGADFLQSLTEERDTLGMTTDELRKYRIAHADLLPDQRAAALAIAEQTRTKEATRAVGGAIAAANAAVAGNLSGLDLKPVKEKTDDLKKQLYAGGEAAGRALIEGLIYGTTSWEQTLGRILVNLAEDKIIGSLRKVLKIASPSQVTRDLGRNTMQGFALGLQDVGTSLSRDLARYADVSGGRRGLGGLAARAGGGAGMTVHQEIHYNVAAIDQRGVAQFFDENGGHIANQVARAARTSSAFRAAVTQGR